MSEHKVLTGAACFFGGICCVSRASPAEVVVLVYLALLSCSVALHMLAGSPAGEPPFWGAPTTPLDECEENFALAPLVGEAWSAAADFAMLGIAAAGWRESAACGGVEGRLLFGVLSLAGICSLAYHVTLSSSAMVWGVLTVAWLVLTLAWTARAHVHCRAADPVARRARLLRESAGKWLSVHLPVPPLPCLDWLSGAAFGASSMLGLMALPEQLVIYPCLPWALYCLARLLGPFLALQRPGSAAAGTVWRMLAESGALGVLALGCLTLDRLRCDDVTRPLRLHAWWQVLVSCAAYVLLTLCCFVIESEKALWRGSGGVCVSWGWLGLRPLLTHSH